MIATLVHPRRGPRARRQASTSSRDRYAVRGRIGVLSDARGLYPRLTARENVRYFGALHGLAGAALDARIDALFATLGLAATRRAADGRAFRRARR